MSACEACDGTGIAEHDDVEGAVVFFAPCGLCDQTGERRPITDTEVRVFRARLGWSQGELARRSRVTQPAISAFERGKRPMPDDRRLRIRRAFELAGQAVAL